MAGWIGASAAAAMVCAFLVVIAHSPYRSYEFLGRHLRETGRSMEIAKTLSHRRPRTLVRQTFVVDEDFDSVFARLRRLEIEGRGWTLSRDRRPSRPDEYAVVYRRAPGRAEVIRVNSAPSSKQCRVQIDTRKSTDFYDHANSALARLRRWIPFG